MQCQILKFVAFDVTERSQRNGFDYDLVDDLTGYAVKLPKFFKYEPILKNSVAERIFLMKDRAAIEEAVGLGAKIAEEMVDSTAWISGHH